MNDSKPSSIERHATSAAIVLGAGFLNGAAAGLLIGWATGGAVLGLLVGSLAGTLLALIIVASAAAIVGFDAFAGYLSGFLWPSDDDGPQADYQDPD